MSSLQPRVVQVYRRTEYEDALMRHGTRQQTAFFLKSRGRHIDELAERHEAIVQARKTAAISIPPDWRRAEVERSDLYRFRFANDDIVLVVGQDGLVANTAKYLDGQPVIGINPDPDRNPGVLVAHTPEASPDLLAAAASQNLRLDELTMVEATTDEGLTLLALNELFVGHRSHQSARYRIDPPDRGSEHQSSSGVLIGTGTGSTGWLQSIWRQTQSQLDLPTPAQKQLCWFAREPWPSLSTGSECTEGLLTADQNLRLQTESDELVCFGDGIEADALRLSWGQTLTISVAQKTLRLATV